MTKRIEVGIQLVGFSILAAMPIISATDKLPVLIATVFGANVGMCLCRLIHTFFRR